MQILPAGPLPTPEDVRDTGEAAADAIVNDPEIAEAREQAREDGVGPLDTLNVGFTTLSQPIQDRTRPDDPEATQAKVESRADEWTEFTEAPGGAADVIDNEQGERGDEIAQNVEETAELWFVEEPAAAASQSLLGYRAVDPHNRGTEPLQGGEGLELAFIAGGQGAGGSAARATTKVAGSAGRRAASGVTNMSARGLTKIGQGIARRVPGGSLPTGGLGEAAEQTARRGDGDALDDAIRRLDDGDGDLVGTRVTRNDAGTTVADEFAESTETAFEESVGDVVAGFPAGRRGGAGLDFGEVARRSGDEFGPLRAGAERTDTGASDETLREAVEEVETTIRRGGDEPAESTASTTGRTTRTGDEPATSSRGGGGGGDGGGGGGGGGGGRGFGSGAGGDDGSRSLAERVRQFFTGTRLRTAGTTAAATTGAVGATYGGARLVSNDSAASGDIEYRVVDTLTGRTPDGRRATGEVISKTDVTNNEDLGYLVYVGPATVVTPGGATRPPAHTLRQLRSGTIREQLSPDFDTLSAARTGFRTWVQDGATGNDSTNGGTQAVEARIEAPRSVPQGDRFTATGRLQNTGSAPYSATVGLFVVVNDQPGRIGESNVSITAGESRTIEFTLSGSETAQAPPGEWPLVLAPVQGDRIGEPLAQTTLGIEPTQQGNSDGGPPNPIEDGDGQWGDAQLVRQLEGGWYLARQDAVKGDRSRFAVLGRDSQGVIYLQSDGSATRSKTTFDSRQKALQAHQRWVQKAQQGETEGPTPNESGPPPNPDNMDDGGSGLLTRRNLLIGGVAVAGLWYVSGGSPLSWVKGKVEGAVDTISNIGGS